MRGQLGMGDIPCERMDYRETQLYRDGSISLLEYQAISPGYKYGFVVGLI